MIDKLTAVGAREAANDSVGLLDVCILLMAILSSLAEFQPTATSLGEWPSFHGGVSSFLLPVKTAIFVKCLIYRAPPSAPCGFVVSFLV